MKNIKLLHKWKNNPWNYPLQSLHFMDFELDYVCESSFFTWMIFPWLFLFFFFLFLCFFHIKKSKKKWYAYLHYYDNFKSCLSHYRVPDKVQTALCSEFFHCVLSTSALLNGGNFILWVSLRLWDHLRSILFKEHTHTHHISIYLWNVKKRLGKQQTSVSHSRWKSPFWPESSCQEWTELA